MKKTMFNRGFTLIELLVVIAIIGILAAVVLASLNDARDSGNDAAAKGSMNSLRNQMELLYNNNSFSYNTLCTHADLDNLQSSIVGNTKANSFAELNTTPSSNSAATCHDDDTAWAASTPLNVDDTSGNQQYFCVDSTGQAIVTTNELASGELVCT